MNFYLGQKKIASVKQSRQVVNVASHSVSHGGCLTGAVSTIEKSIALCFLWHLIFVYSTRV